MLQFTRRTVQILALLLIVVLPIASYYMAVVSGKQQKTFEIAIKENPVPALTSVYIYINKKVNPPHNPNETAPKFDPHKGGIFSLTMFGYNITDPLAVIGALVASRGFFLKVFLWTLVPLVLTFLLGKVFCSWVCPINTILEWVDSVRRLLNKLRIPPWDLQLSYNVKYYLLLATLAMALGGVSVYGYILPYAILTREVYYFIFYGSVSILAIALVAIVVVELLFSQRMWCRYLCPEGAFLGLVGAKRILNIKRKQELCPQGCIQCGEVCKQGVKPYYEEHFGMECDNCGVCISECPSDALNFCSSASKSA